MQTVLINYKIKNQGIAFVFMKWGVDTNPHPPPPPTHLEEDHNVKILWRKQVLWQWMNLCTVIILDIVLSYIWHTEHFFCVSTPVFKWLVISLYNKTLMVVCEIITQCSVTVQHMLVAGSLLIVSLLSTVIIFMKNDYSEELLKIWGHAVV